MNVNKKYTKKGRDFYEKKYFYNNTIHDMLNRLWK